MEFLEQYLQNSLPENQPRAEALSALHPAAPWSILAITFTNKAANELKGAVRNRVSKSVVIASPVFHSKAILI